MGGRLKELNIVFLVTIIVFLLAGEWLGRLGDADPLIIQTLGQTALVLPYVVYLLVTRQNVPSAIRLRRIRIPNVFLLVLFSYAIYPLLGFVSAVSLLFSKNVINQRVFEMTGGRSLLLSLLVLAFVPCLFEEFIYRGLLYNGYRKISVVKGMFLSSLLFGLMHRNLNQCAYTFVMGLIMVVLVEATGSILAPMIVHFTINGSSVVMSQFAAFLTKGGERGMGGYLEETNRLLESREVVWQAVEAFGGIGRFTFLIAVAILLLIARLEGRKEFWKGMLSRDGAGVRGGWKSLVTLPLVVGMSICLYYIVVGMR